MFEEEKQINFLIKKETDLISSAPMIAFKAINVFCGDWLELSKDALKVKEKVENIVGIIDTFFEFSVKGLNYQEISNRLDILDSYNFLLTNTSDIKEKIKAIKRIAPPLKINLIVNTRTWNSIDLAKDEDYFNQQSVVFTLFKKDGEVTQLSPLILGTFYIDKD